MAEHVYKLTEIVGTSTEGHDAAIKVALDRARQSLRDDLEPADVAQRGYVDPDDGKVIFQVTMKVGFTLE
jgi:dodecin